MDVFNSIIGYDLTTSNTYYRCPITITQVTINYSYQFRESQIDNFSILLILFSYTLQRRDSANLLATNETKFIYLGGYLTNLL